MDAVVVVIVFVVVASSMVCLEMVGLLVSSMVSGASQTYIGRTYSPRRG